MCRVPGHEMFGMRERVRGALALGVVLVACAAVPATASAAAAVRLRVGGSVNQVYVTGARPGERLVLVNRRGARVGVQAAGSLGGLIFREVKLGAGVSRATGRRRGRSVYGGDRAA